VYFCYRRWQFAKIVIALGVICALLLIAFICAVGYIIYRFLRRQGLTYTVFSPRLIFTQTQGRIYSKRGPCSVKMWGPLIYEYPVTPPPDCLYPTRTVVIIDKSFPPNHYLNIFGLLPCCKKWKENILSFCGNPLFVGAPVRPNMLNMPKTAYAQSYCKIVFV